MDEGLDLNTPFFSSQGKTMEQVFPEHQFCAKSRTRPCGDTPDARVPVVKEFLVS